MPSSGDQTVKIYFVYGIQKPLGRPRRRWEDNIKMDLQEVGCGGTDWIELVLDRDRWRALVKTVMNLQVP
jgi:hypothetical protein